MSLPQIPIDDLPEPEPYTRIRTGHIFSHNVTAPVIVTTNPAGTTVTLPDAEHRADNLGEFLRDISGVLSKEQVESLVKGEEVKL